ncbi:MAG: hypothetical protein LUG66_08450 [Clostridiales bacterium]|nr:hypothetical protein [Clostridiales bacterium]
MLKRLFLFMTVLTMFTVNVCAETESSEETEIVRTITLDCGVNLYVTSEGKWGAYGDSFKLDPVYYLPTSNQYFDYGDTFVLAQKPNTYLNNRGSFDNTYYVFKSNGELIKTLTYSIWDVIDEQPGGYTFYDVEAWVVSGSNIVFAGRPIDESYPCENLAYTYIKRLYSEKVVDGYYSVQRYDYEEEGEFTAVEASTWRWCVLNQDGSFKRYRYNADGSYKILGELSR